MKKTCEETNGGKKTNTATFLHLAPDIYIYVCLHGEMTQPSERGIRRRRLLDGWACPNGAPASGATGAPQGTKKGATDL